MNGALLLAGLSLTGAPLPTMQGHRLSPGTACYSIMRGEVVIGTTVQRIRSSRLGNRPVWDIVVHQKQNDGSFDMRDHFVVDRTTLQAISLNSWRGHDRRATDWHRVKLRYTAGNVTGTKETAAGISKIDARLNGPTWDGNLWGVTFAALPLRVGHELVLPYWQYDKGSGRFTVRVVGTEQVDGPSGTVSAWILEAGDDPNQLVRYSIAQTPRIEIGYRAGPFAQRLDRTCRRENSK